MYKHAIIIHNHLKTINEIVHKNTMYVYQYILTLNHPIHSVAQPLWQQFYVIPFNALT